MRHGRFSLMDCLDDIESGEHGARNDLPGSPGDRHLRLALCDMDTCEDFALWGAGTSAWLKRFLTLKNGTPSSSATFYRLFRALDPKQTFFRRWVSQIARAVLLYLRWMANHSWFGRWGEPTGPHRQRLLDRPWHCLWSGTG